MAVSDRIAGRRVVASISGGNSISSGQSLTLTTMYEDRDSGATITFFLDGDQNPLNGTGASLGAGVIVLRAQSFGPRGVRQQLDLTVARGTPRGIRVLSWRY